MVCVAAELACLFCAIFYPRPKTMTQKDKLTQQKIPLIMSGIFC
jgi:hypothetical protein